MESDIPTPPASSAITTASSISENPNRRSFPFHYILEISLISAQELAPVAKSMRTYAVAWVHPDGRKLSTRVDPRGHTNPTWNDKFAFWVDEEFLLSESSAVTVDIYALSWFRDILVGTVRIFVCNLINPGSIRAPNSSRFVALQVRRSSGSPQGILNMGVSVLDSTKQSIPLYPKFADENEKNPNKEILPESNGNCLEDKPEKLNAKIQLWRSMSMGSEDTNHDHNGSICNGSAVNGSEISDIGPSASVVAAEIAKKSRPPAAPPVTRKTSEGHDTESSILEELTVEEATAKGLRPCIGRWRSEFQPTDEDGRQRLVGSGGGNKHLRRRHSDGGGGLFSCFGNAYGFEFTIVCGATNNNNTNNNYTDRSKYRKKKSSEANSA